MKTNKHLFNLSGGAAAEVLLDTPVTDALVPTEKTRRILCILRVLLRLIRLLLGKTKKPKQPGKPEETGRGESEG